MNEDRLDEPTAGDPRPNLSEPSQPLQARDTEATQTIADTDLRRLLGPLTKGAVIAERYEIGDVIGEGGFGKVYLAQDRRLDNRKVVIKTLKAAQEGWYAKRFEHEVRALARMDHPGIVGVRDSGNLPDGSAFLVMQYVPGEGLHQLLRKGPIAPDRGLKLLAQMAEALAVAHDAEILHRDLKPANVIIRDVGKPEERAVLIDFGIARTDGADTSAQTSVISGTPKYMASEQLIGRTSVASDLFSLGLIAVEVLTGKTPERLTGGEDLREPVRNALCKVNPPIREAAIEAIVKAVGPKAEERGLSVREFARTLVLPEAPERPNLPIPPPAELQQTQETRSRKQWISAAALFVLIAAAASYYVPKLLSPAGEPPNVTMTAALAVRGAGQGVSPRPISTAEVLHAGDGVQVELQTSQPGFIYLFDASSVSPAKAPQFAVLFPGGGGESPALAPAVSMRLPVAPDEWFKLDGSSPEETIWIVWSRSQLSELEELQKYSKPPQYGLIPEESTQKLQRFLNATVPPTEEPTRKITTWQAATDLLVARLQLRVR
jgi:serine/threonine protein kinase